MKRKSEKGFTLIELLVVIAILSLLVGIIVPNLLSFIGAGSLTAANLEAGTIQVAVIAYSAEHDGSYPEGDYGPGDLGDLGPYLLKDLTGSYSVSDEGEIAGTGGWSGLTWENGQWVEED